MPKFFQPPTQSEKLKLIALLALSSILAIPVIAQTPTKEIGAVAIEGAARFIIEAKEIKDRYQIDIKAVGTERAPLQAGQKLPVIYVLDGNTQFQIVAPLANLLASARLGGFGPGIPQALVVAIGYLPDPSLSNAENFTTMTLTRRHRDYTPVLDPVWVKSNPDLPPHGGAPDFLAFIETELKPFIASRYPVDGDNQTIIGHSMGGLFVLYALLQSPTSFDRYIVSSPGLAWGDFRPLGTEIKFDGSKRNTAAKVFIAAGGREPADMIGTASAMSQTLKEDFANIDVTFQLIPDEDHVSVIPTAIIRGLQTVFN